MSFLYLPQTYKHPLALGIKNTSIRKTREIFKT